MSRKDITDKQVIEAYLKCKAYMNKWPYDILQEETGQPQKVCIAAMERAYSRGYINCGVSLRSGWVTDKGIKILKEESK